MRRSKKIGLLTGLALSVCACGFALGACKTTPEIALLDFTDIERTAELDSTYVLPVCNVTDESGNDYRVSYTVKTAGGEEIVVANNSFAVKLLEDYYITCTAELGGGDIRTRTITLKVEDKGLPEITFAEAKRGIENTEYTLPEVTVTDSSKETITPSVKVFALNGEEKGAEQTVANGKFTPTQRGYYLLEATATDGSGNTKVDSTKIFVREAPEASEIVSFKYAEDTDCLAFKGDIAWEESYAGESGVAKLTYTGNKNANALCIGSLQDISESSSLYTAYDTLVVRMYIVRSSEITNYFNPTDGNLRISQCTDGRAIASSNIYSQNAVEYNKWVNYLFDIEALRYFDMEKPNTNNAKLWSDGVIKDGDDALVHSGEFYIADIYCTNTVDVEVSGSYQVGQTLSFGVSSGEASYLVEKPDGTMDTVQGDSYTITQKGTHKVIANGEGVYGEARFTALRAGATGEVLSFDEADDIDLAYNTVANSLSIVEHADETGVLKLEWSGGRWPTISFQSLASQATRATYDYVTFRMYLPSGTAFESVSIKNGASGNKQPIEGTTIVYDQWFDCRFAVSAASNWTDGASASELWTNECKFFLTIPAVDGQTEYQATIYIADIRLEKQATVSVTGATSVDSQVTFGATQGNQALSMTDARVIVTTPSGTTTSVTGASYTIAEKGVHTVEVTGANFYGKTTFTATRAVGATELISFDYEEDIQNVAVTAATDTKAGGTAVRLASYAEETGVLQLTWSGNKWPTVAISFLQSKAVYQQYSYVVFRVYAPDGLANFAVQSGYKDGTTEKQNYYPTIGNTALAAGEWHDVKFTTSCFAKWTDGASANELLSATCVLWGTFADSAVSGTLYIANVYMSNE
ncbi:MAG: hypothetical protein IJ514_05390 [Clostridia bacterium]|nr:hypothetical protein [Clostridia bacterium]